MKKILFAQLFIICLSAFAFAHVPLRTLVQIVKGEDERRYDGFLENLLKNADAHIRTRAALAAGRIGDEKAIPALADLLQNDKDNNVKTMAAFALGETESTKAADAILNILNNLRANPEIRARAIEAAGKIAAANSKDEKSKLLGEAIVSNLEFEDRKRSGPFLNVIEFGLTAALRARPANAERIVIEYTRAYTPQIRANALNTLARLRSKNANKQARELLEKDENATVRANAARVLGAAEDKDSFELLLNVAVNDKDSRVRVSAIRALGSLKDAKAADKLLERGENLFADYKKSKFANPSEKSELLEIATALGNLLKNTNNERAINFLEEFRKAEKYKSPETEIALARVSPKFYAEKTSLDQNNAEWQSFSSIAQAFGEFAELDPDKFKSEREKTHNQLKIIIETYPQLYGDSGLGLATSDILRSYAKFKSNDLPEFLRENLSNENSVGWKSNERIFIRAAAAELLGEQTATKENTEALKKAFAESLKADKKYNDAQLAILSALVKLDKKESFESLRLALNAPDYLVRKHAATLIKQNDLTKDFSNVEKMVGTVKPYNPKTGTKLGQILNKEADYVRAVSRKNGTVKAVFTTEKGNFTIDLTPEDAPLTVDNFIKLAKQNYFNGVSVHRVVPNFVMQDGDPRGDGNGGPGWQIRCEINMLEFDRGAVGMALSGKDTGGSQWFVTHSSQPHLDGGYTVFGRVNENDLKIVDSIVRGDKILSVKIVEQNSSKKK